MAVFVKRGEIESSLGILINEYVQDCIKKKELPKELTELIKHNFLAKYVYFNKKDMTVEIGINVSEHQSNSYPEIKVFTYPIEETQNWMASSYKSDYADIEFYGRLLNRNGSLYSRRIVVL